MMLKFDFNHCRASVVAALSLLLVPGSAAAQQLVAGRVVELGSGKELAGVAIALAGSSLTDPLVVSSGADGRFVLAGVEAGSYRLSASLDGYYTVERSLQIRPRQTRSLDVVLRPVQHARSEVFVSGTPLFDTTNYSSSVAVSRQAVERMPLARSENLSDVVPTLYAGAVQSHDNLVHLRGNELSLHYFIDGVSFLDNTNQQFSPTLRPRVFNSINMITGGFAAEFGNRFGGILDMTTKSGLNQPGHGSVVSGGGSLDRGDVAFEYGNRRGNWGYYVNGSALNSGRFLNPPQEQDLHDSGRGGRGFLRLDYKSGAADSFRVVLSGGGTNFDLPNTEEEDLVGRDATKRTRQQTAIGSWDHLFGDDALLTTSFYQRYARERFVPTSDPLTIFADGRREDLTVGGKIDYTRGFPGGHVFKSGVDVKGLSLDEGLAFDPRQQEKVSAAAAATAAVAMRSFAGSADETGGLESFDFAEDRTGNLVGIYLQDEFQPLAGLTANLGLRIDRYDLVVEQTEVSPRINLAYAIRDDVGLHFAYNRFFSPPPIENLLLASKLGKESLPVRPLTNNHFEFGVRTDMGGHAVAAATAYYRSGDNAFETGEIANTRVFLPVNFAGEDSKGLELSLRVPEIETIGLSGFVNYSLVRTYFIGPATGGFSDEELAMGQRILPAFDQKHTLVSGINWRHRRSGFWTHLGFEYGSGTPVEVEAGEDTAGVEGAIAATDLAESRSAGAFEPILFERLPSHSIFNLSVGIDLLPSSGHRLSLQFSVENLTDDVFGIAKDSEFTPVQFASPRAYSVQARLEF